MFQSFLMQSPGRTNLSSSDWIQTRIPTTTVTIEAKAGGNQRWCCNQPLSGSTAASLIPIPQQFPNGKTRRDFRPWFWMYFPPTHLKGVWFCFTARCLRLETLLETEGNAILWAWFPYKVERACVLKGARVKQTFSSKFWAISSAGCFCTSGKGVYFFLFYFPSIELCKKREPEKQFTVLRLFTSSHGTQTKIYSHPQTCLTNSTAQKQLNPFGVLLCS